MRVLMPLPDRDFDTTEVAVPWQVLTAAGHEVGFVVRDGSYVSARWPGDAYLFGRRFRDLPG
jgi:putative intracellular protease/amidase